MGLLGDEIVELLLGNHTISVTVRTLDHFLEDSVISEFAQILGDLAQVLEGDEA